MFSGGHDPLQRRADHLLGRGRDHVEGEAMAVDARREDVDERVDVRLQPDPPPHLDEVLPSARTGTPGRAGAGRPARRPAARGGRPASPSTLSSKPGRPSSSLSTSPGVVEAERLVEVAGDQVVLRGVRPLSGGAPGDASAPRVAASCESRVASSPSFLVAGRARHEPWFLRPMGPSLRPHYRQDYGRAELTGLTEFVKISVMTISPGC